MLVAPAGTGKTVLLSDWASRRRRADQDIFWVPAQEPAVLEQIIDAIDASDPVESAGTVVVDDAHLLPKPTLDRLARLLTDAPRSVRLLLASRYDLPLPVTELQLRGLGSTLRARDLSFTDEEAAELVHIYAEDASAEDVSRLQRRTAGWAAALVLAARALAATGALIVTEQPVLDALLGETFGTLDPRAQKVLLSSFGTAMVTGRLATVLSGDSEAATILADLAGRGLLVTAYMDDSGSEPHYQYHPLLVELLRRRVPASPEASRLVIAAHRRAAHYHENRGEIERALRSAIGADDPDLVARVLLSHGPVMLAGGNASLISDGFEALPDDYVDAHPQLVGVRGLLRRLTGDVRGAIMDTVAATGAVRDADPAKAGPDRNALEADMHLLQLWQSRYGWYDVRDATEQARAFLESGHGHYALAPERLSWLLIELAAAETWADELDNALGHLDEALVTARMAGHSQLIAGALAHRAVIQYARGQVENAARSAQSALDTGGSRLADDYAARAQVVLGLAALSRLELDEAQRWLRSVNTADVADADTVVVTLRSILRAMAVIEAGKLAEARTELATDPVAVGPLPSFLARDLALLRMWVAVLVGDRAEAENQIAVLDRMDSDGANLVRAMGSIVESNVPSTLEAIEAALAKPVHPMLAASAMSVRTVLLLRIGDHHAAEAALVETLNRVAPQRLLHAVSAAARERDFMDLLRRNATEPTAHPFASVALDKLSGYRAGWATRGGATLLDRTRMGLAAPPRRLDAMIDGVRIKLTGREADVLDQLALGSAYSEIAHNLFITENTVKTHLMALYRKLGVDKRSAALRVARDVGLIQPPSPG